MVLKKTPRRVLKTKAEKDREWEQYKEQRKQAGPRPQFAVLVTDENGDTSYLQAIGADRLGRPATGKTAETAAPAEDSGDYVPVSPLWAERFPGKRYRTTTTIEFLDKHQIRYRKPRSNRLEVHAGDWTRHFLDCDRRASEETDSQTEGRSLTGDSVATPLFLENAAKLFGKIQQTKRGRQ